MKTTTPFLWKNTLSLPPALFPQEIIARLKKTGLNIDDMGIALVNLNGPLLAYTTDLSNFKKTYYAASLVKIAAMYAAFYLQNRLQTIASNLKNLSLTEIESKLSKEWRVTINGTSPAVVGDFPQLNKIFSSTIFDFKTDFQEDMKLMIKKSDNYAAAQCIGKLGFDYMNGALCYSGFYSKEKNKGLWLSGNYDRLIGKRPAGAAQSNMTASAEAVSLFLVNLAKDQLISPSASKKMKEMMEGAYSKYTEKIKGYEVIDLETGAVKQKITGLHEYHKNPSIYGKIGIGDSRYTDKVIDDCAIVKCHDIHYATVFLFGKNLSKYRYYDLITILDKIAQEMFRFYDNTFPFFKSFFNK